MSVETRRPATNTCYSVSVNVVVWQYKQTSVLGVITSFLTYKEYELDLFRFRINVVQEIAWTWWDSCIGDQYTARFFTISWQQDNAGQAHTGAESVWNFHPQDRQSKGGRTFTVKVRYKRDSRNPDSTALLTHLLPCWYLSNRWVLLICCCDKRNCDLIETMLWVRSV